MEPARLRLLLPFTNNIHMEALDFAIAFAKSLDALLVPLALIYEPKGQYEDIRYELIAQANDFLVAISQKAARYQVPIERYRVYTDEVVKSILELTQNLECKGVILLVSSDASGILLETNVIIRLLKVEGPQWHLIHVAPSPSVWKHIRGWIFQMRHALKGMARPGGVQM